MYSRRETTGTEEGCLCCELGMQLSRLAIIMGVAASYIGGVSMYLPLRRAEEKERLLRESEWRATRVSESTAEALKEAGFAALLLCDPRDGSYYVRQAEVVWVGQYDENRPPVRLEPGVREEIREIGLEAFITPLGDLRNVSGAEILTRENPYLMFRVPDDVYQKLNATKDFSGALSVSKVEPGVKQIKVRNQSREQDKFRQLVSKFYEEPKKKGEKILTAGLLAITIGVVSIFVRLYREFREYSLFSRRFRKR